MRVLCQIRDLGSVRSIPYLQPLTSCVAQHSSANQWRNLSPLHSSDRRTMLSTQTSLPHIEIKSVGSGEESILFMHGWPDDEHVFDYQIDRLKQRYTCLKYTLPWFGPAEEAKKNAAKYRYSRWGYSFEETVDAIVEAVRQLQGANVRLTVIGHDWGAYHAELLQQRYPGMVEKLVLLDVGGVVEHKRGLQTPRILELVGAGVLYQYKMILAYWLSGISSMGDRLSTSSTRWAKEQLLKGVAEEFKPLALEKFEDACGEAGYVYYHFHRDYALELLGLKSYPRAQLCPTLYLFGAKKPINLHPAAFTRRLRAEEGCAVIPLDCGHWVTIEQAEQVTSHIEAYLDDPAGYSEQLRQRPPQSRL